MMVKIREPNAGLFGSNEFRITNGSKLKIVLRKTIVQVHYISKQNTALHNLRSDPQNLSARAVFRF